MSDRNSEPGPPPGWEPPSSYIVTAICQGGIVVAADTRYDLAVVEHGAPRPLASLERVPKIYRLGPYALAAGDRGDLLGICLAAILSEFWQEARGNLDAGRLIPGLFVWAQERLPPELLTGLARQSYICAGYSGQQPQIWVYRPDRPGQPLDCIVEDGYVETGDVRLAVEVDDLLRLGAGQAAALLKRHIQDHARDGSGRRVPVDVLLVTRRGCRWLERSSARAVWSCTQDLFRDIEGGRVDLHPIPPMTREETERRLAEHLAAGGGPWGFSETRRV